ncbi:MAG: hypothetical protein ACFFE8_11135 [Candidatus Heimdallarchaeota archaeon]
MGSLQLAWVDIRRTRSRTNIFIGIQSLITASGMLFNRLSQFLGGQVSSYTGLNPSIISILYNFLSFLSMTALITGILVATLLSSILTIGRMKDLAVLLAMGGSFKDIQRVPLAQMLLLTLVSGILGWIINILIQFLFQFLLGIPLISVMELLIPVPETIYVVLQLLGVYFVAGLIINYIIRQNFREIIEGQYSLDLKSSHTIWGYSITKQVAFWVGYLVSKRFRVLSSLMLIGTFLLVFLISFAVFGGNIIHVSTNSFASRGYGDQVIVVTPIEISSLVEDLYDPSTQTKPFQSVLLSKDYLLPPSFLQILPDSGTYETRLLLGGEVDILLPLELSENGSYPASGIVSGKSFFWGIDSQNFSLFNYFSIKDEPITTKSLVYVGDGLFDGKEPTAESVIPINVTELKRFEIRRVLVDPFARGDCIYMDIKELVVLRELSMDSWNVAFIQNPSSQIMEVIDEDPTIGYFSLDDYKNRYIEMGDPFWASSFGTSLPLLISTTLAIVAYSSLIARSILVTDLRTLYTLGGGPPILFRVICWVNIWNLKTVPISVIFGLASAYTFLITEPLLPTFDPYIGLTIGFSSIIIVAYVYFKKLSFRLAKEFVR